MKKNKYLSFFYGFAMGLSIKLVGTLFLGEVIALITLPIIKFKRLLKLVPEFTYILVCFLLLLVAQILSDIINNSGPEDYLRGWFTIILGGLSMIFLLNQFLDKERNIVYFLLGSFLVLLFFDQGDLNLELQVEDTNYFKIRFVGFLNASVLLMSYFLMAAKKFNTILILFLSYAILCLYMDARSNGLSFLFSSFVLSLKFYSVKLSKSKIIFFSLISLFVLYGLFIFYVDLVLNSGFGGSNARLQIAKTVNPYNPFELLYYGRSEFFVLIEAIKDNPYYGYGSWAKDPNFKFARIQQMLSHEIHLEDAIYIRAHSMFLGFWVYAGILGAGSILLIYLKALKIVNLIFRSNAFIKSLPIVIFATFQAIWSFFFSPTQDIRLSLPFFIALILSLNYRLVANPNFNKIG